MDTFTRVWVCSDCALLAFNDDSSGLDDERYAQVRKAIDELGPVYSGSGRRDEAFARCESCKVVADNLYEAFVDGSHSA